MQLLLMCGHPWRFAGFAVPKTMQCKTCGGSKRVVAVEGKKRHKPATPEEVKQLCALAGIEYAP